MTKENLWETVLAQIQLAVSEASFATWFKNTRIVNQETESLIVSVPNSFVKEWLEQKYQKTILKIFHEQDLSIKRISFVVGKDPFPALGSLPISQKGEQLVINDFKKNTLTGLNQRYTFDNFIVASFNELANAAATAVSENPGLVYNPLFVYGKVGLGKTHLLQATGNEIINKFEQKKVKYVPSERFVSDFIASIKNGTIERFKQEHCQVNVLILDDIQFLAGKEKTQEAFFHIFNDLYQQNRQIILSSDRPPKAIPALTERLRSRFEGGMIADIGFPDLETRIAILKSKAQERNSQLPDEIYEFLADQIKINIRELEGALIKVLLHQKTKTKTLTVKEVKSIIKEITFSPLEKITPQKIIQAVAKFYDIKEKDLLSSSRKKEFVRPRQIAMFLLRTTLQGSYPFIARRFGGRDHTTAIYGITKISKELEENENLQREMDLIKTWLSSS